MFVLFSHSKNNLSLEKQSRSILILQWHRHKQAKSSTLREKKRKIKGSSFFYFNARNWQKDNSNQPPICSIGFHGPFQSLFMTVITCYKRAGHFCIQNILVYLATGSNRWYKCSTLLPLKGVVTQQL